MWYIHKDVGSLGLFHRKPGRSRRLKLLRRIYASLSRDVGSNAER